MLGAIVGDIVGSRFEFENNKRFDFDLFDRECAYTDDTLCSIATADWLMKSNAGISYTDILRKWCRNAPMPMGGYGSMFKKWLLSPNPVPYNSWGNGSAMRVAPVGWAFDTIEKTLEIAAQTAEVTHNHPEGIKGAQATAAAIFLARKGYSKYDIKKYIETEFEYDLGRTCDEIRSDYEFNESCQYTVPEAIIAFLESVDFESAIRLAVSLGGDSDTLTCITGGIAEAFYGGVPKNIVSRAISYLTPEMQDIVRTFQRAYSQP